MNMIPFKAAGTTRGQPGIEARRLSKTFGERTVVDEIDLVMPKGQILAIVGESGCGKSTLLRLIAGLEKADSGLLNVDGQISIAFQDARLLPWQRVWENVCFGLRESHTVRRKMALEALEEVRLTHLVDAWPATLSGGEAQRVALARSLIRNPSVLLLDEPFGALDALTRLRMHKLLRALWQRHGFTVVLVTHDVDEALALADRVILLGQGKIQDQFEITLSHPRNPLVTQFGEFRRRLFKELGVGSD
jgi:sulfonate transport system ATP-binding protein